MKHIKSHIELDNDEIVEYVKSILFDLDDLETITYQAGFYNNSKNYKEDTYCMISSIWTDREYKCDKNLPIDRIDLTITTRLYTYLNRATFKRQFFDYSSIKDVVEHINSYLWDRGFGQDPKASFYYSWRETRGLTGQTNRVEGTTNCILLDFEGVTNIKEFQVRFKKKK